MRKLASIQRIIGIEEIEGCDNIVLAQVLGWNVIVKRGEFKVGDLCVYCEIDSVLPEKEEFEFLRQKHFRIKTMKMKGVYSQGICFPLLVLPAGEYNEDDDVTEMMGVTKWDPEQDAGPTGSSGSRTFPHHLVPATDETRIQTFGGEFAKMQEMCDSGERFVATLKVDGSSMTIILQDGMFRVCSHHTEKNPPQENEERVDQFWKAAIDMELELKIRSIFDGRNIAIQGELAGPGIQKNRLKLDKLHFFAFYAFDIDAQKYMEWAEFVTAMNDAGIETVPIISDNFNLSEYNAKELLVWVDNLDQINSLRKQFPQGAQFEGVVIARANNVYEINRKGDNPHGRFSVKVVSNKYLLKE